MQINALLKAVQYQLLIVSLMSVSLLGLAGSPLFAQTGIWYQSEPIIIALQVLGALNAASLLLSSFLYPRLTRGAITHPIVIIAALIAFYSLFLVVFDLPYIAQLLGSEQTGLGASWFAFLSVVSANARFARKVLSKKSFLLLGLFFLTVGLSLSMLTVFGQDRWRMFFFDDHIGFFAIYLWPLAFLIFPKKPVAFVAALFVCFLIVDVSDNFSALLALLVMVACTLVLTYSNCFSLSRKRFAQIGGGLCIFSAVFILVIVAAFDGNSALYAPLSNKIASTMHSRHLLLGVVADSSLGDLYRLFVGNGWGSFANMLMMNVPFDKTAVFYSGNLADIHSQSWIWDSLLRFDFHSHNIFVETMGSIGIVGFLLMLAYVYSLVRFANEKYVIWAFVCTLGFVLLNSMWFQMPSTLGMMAIVFGFLSGKPLRNKGLDRTYKPLLALLIISFGFGAVSAISLAQAGHAQIGLNNNPPSMGDNECRPIIDDAGKGGRHFAEIFKSYVHKLNDKIEKDADSVTPAHWQRLDQFFCNADDRLENKQELVSGVRALMARGDYVFRYRDQASQQNSLYHRIINGWAQNLDQVMALAPKRYDLAIPYFNWLLEQGAEDDLYKRAQGALAYRATKPIGLWFSGIVLLNNPSKKDQAVNMLKQSLGLGIEKFFPVEEGLKEALKTL